MRGIVTHILLMVGVLASACGPQRRAPHENPQLDSETIRNGGRSSLRILTFNTWSVKFRDDHDELVQRTAQRVAQEDVDVVALQEVWRAEDAQVFAGALEEAGFVHQHGRASGEPFARGSSGLLIASRWPLRSRSFSPFRAGSLPWWPLPVDWFAAKGLLGATVQTPEGDVRLLNTHLHAAYGEGGHLAARLGQSLEVARALRPRTAPTLLVGDVNTRPGEVPFRALRLSGALALTARAGVDVIMTRSGRNARLEAVESRVAMAEALTLDSGRRAPPSDHLGVSASFRIARPLPGEEPAHDTRALPLIRDALDAALEQAALHQWVGRALSALAALVLIALLRRRRRALLPALFVLWIGAWCVYHGWLVGPEQHRQIAEQRGIAAALAPSR